MISPQKPRTTPAADSVLRHAAATRKPRFIGGRLLYVSLLAGMLAVVTAVSARGLLALIGLITNLAFYGRWSWAFVSPQANRLGPIVILVPVVGAIIVGFMARYGSAGIRGHGIPEAMEHVLTHDSRIPPRMVFLKPLSAALSIGTGGPFGAEGPVIATGGAMGSILGQWLPVTAQERKALLAAGAAAGMAAVFGTPVAALLLAVELLLFEWSARSLVPVAIAAAIAAMVRIAFVGTLPFFLVPKVTAPVAWMLSSYAGLGVAVGLAAVAITRGVYLLEDLFERLPIYWMWWPALGAVGVGLIGYVAPDTMGVGYGNIQSAISGQVVTTALLMLMVLKCASWMIALSSGTSGGTLAPLMTVGACLGALLGRYAAFYCPSLGLNPELAALVATAAIFAGASRALLTSMFFVLETTWQPAALLPLLIGSGAAYLVSGMLMPNTIMTEKIVRRGVMVPTDYEVDILTQTPVDRIASKPAFTLPAKSSIANARALLAQYPYRSFPLIDAAGEFAGCVLATEILAADDATQIVAEIAHSTASIACTESVRDAVTTLCLNPAFCLPVVDEARRVVGVVTQKDIFRAWPQGGSEVVV